MIFPASPDLSVVQLSTSTHGRPFPFHVISLFIRGTALALLLPLVSHFSQFCCECNTKDSQEYSPHLRTSGQTPFVFMPSLKPPALSPYFLDWRPYRCTSQPRTGLKLDQTLYQQSHNSPSPTQDPPACSLPCPGLRILVPFLSRKYYCRQLYRTK